MKNNNKDKLLQSWLDEQSIAHIKGWDFSHLQGRYEEEDTLPWDYKSIILKHLQPHHKILDMGTGGGEFLLSLGHDPKLTAATEAYPPNIAYCEEKLLPLGIDFKAVDDKELLPFADESFDLIINRHDSMFAKEIYRCLKPGGFFITQQVGADNDKELIELLLGKWNPGFPEQSLPVAKTNFQNAGFLIERAEEHYGDIRFFDVGALVWFARIIEWEFEGFSVEHHEDALWKAQAILEEKGAIAGHTHRFMLVGRKPA